MINQQCQCFGAIWFEQLRIASRHARTVHVHIVYCAQMFLFQTTKMLNNIILTDSFSSVWKLWVSFAKCFATSLFWLIAQSNYIYFMEIPSSLTGFREQNKMDVCCSFKSLVGGQCSFDRRDRSQSIEIVPLLSCSKDITRHKSLWQFQVVKNGRTAHVASWRQTWVFELIELRLSCF